MLPWWVWVIIGIVGVAGLLVLIFRGVIIDEIKDRLHGVPKEEKHIGKHRQSKEDV